MMKSLRRDSLSCLLLNCLVVSGVIIIMSLSLHSSPPIVSHSSYQKLSLLEFSKAPLLYNDVKPTLRTLPNVSLFSFQKQVSEQASKENTHQETVPVEITPLSVSVKPINYPQQHVALLNNSNKDNGGFKHLAKKPGRSSPELQNNELLAGLQPRHVNLESNHQQMSKKNSSFPSPSADLAKQPYLVKKPMQHISSQRKLSSQNGQPVLSQQSVQPVNWTRQTIDAMLSRTTVIEDTVNQFSFKHDVLPLVAFIDTRPRYQHTNSTVILVQVRDVKRIRYNRIIGCGIDDIRAKSFRAKPLFVYRNWIHANVPNLTHSEAVVNCYDLPSVNGSKPFVLYRPFRAPGLLKVYSERPVMVTKGTMKPLSVVVCATVYGEPPWLSHWLRYQETLGVDHIRLYAQQSFLDKGGLELSEVKRLVHNGLLEVDLRSTHLTNKQVYYYSQPLYYQDCLLRYRGIYEFAFLIDTDDFFVPRVPGQTDVHYYVEKLFPKEARLASIKLDWVRYFPSCGFRTPLDKIVDGNLTDHLSTYRGYREYVKSVHRLELVTEAAVHEVTYCVPGYTKGVASNSSAYMAHIRKTSDCPTDLSNPF